MSDKDKVKLGAAAGMLVVAMFLIYWFALRTPPVTPIAEAPPASVDGSDGQPPAGNRRISPELAKKLNEKK